DEELREELAAEQPRHRSLERVLRLDHLVLHAAAWAEDAASGVAVPELDQDGPSVALCRGLREPPGERRLPDAALTGHENDRGERRKPAGRLAAVSHEPE